MMAYAWGISSILTSSMAALPILMSVLLSQLKSYISSSTSYAGVAAAAGEMAKDEEHLAAVVKVGA